MTYADATEFLFTQLPMFQNIGAGAYKPGLETTLNLAAAFGNPHQRFPVIHVAGTNGKGSTTHSIASVLQQAGYRVGLFTSPHLVDFRERIRVNGEMISQSAVIDFVERYQAQSRPDTHPTFFELTTIMAFEYFARCGVDIAVVEVGLGGRLDSTNIVNPILSVITNISFDHMALLGNTLPQIATEKAGIIKRQVPVVVGEAEGDVRQVFADRAAEMSSPIVFAAETTKFTSVNHTSDDRLLYHGTPYGTLASDLTGDCQPRNFATVLCCLDLLLKLGWRITPDDVRNGLANVCTSTGLAGRWMTISHDPLTVCDTGHNEGGWQYIAPRLASHPGHCHIVIGFVNDKEIDKILAMMPTSNATYYFTQASVKRALPADQLRQCAMAHGLTGNAYLYVAEAYSAALTASKPSDIIYVGGSTFIVADFLSHIRG